MKRGGTVCGAVSLTVIFCVLCMTVFAALTFVTANRERVLSELDAQRAAEFYQADRDATRIAAALRSGEIVRDADSANALPDADILIIDDNQSDILIIEDEDGGNLPEIRYEETAAGTIAEFSVPAGGEQRLDVRLLLRDGDMDILAWRKVYAGDWNASDNLTLADIDDILALANIDGTP